MFIRTDRGCIDYGIGRCVVLPIIPSSRLGGLAGVGVVTALLYPELLGRDVPLAVFIDAAIPLGLVAHDRPDFPPTLSYKLPTSISAM